MSPVTFRELDAALKLPKGSAFRAFKARLDALVEGRDFRRLDAIADADEIEALRRGGRIYRSSVHVVLLAPATAQRLRAELTADPR